MRRMLLMSAAVLALAACDKNDDPDPKVTMQTVTFEEAELDANGLLTGKALATETDGGFNEYDGMFYTSGFASFSCYYSDQWGSDYCAGFTVSDNTDMVTAGYGNQYSVYAKGGVDASKKFAVAYYDSYNAENGNEGAVPTVTFPRKVNPVGVWVNNSTYAYLWWLQGDSGSGSGPEKVDAVLTIEGYADGSLARSVSVKLVDAEKGLVLDEWTYQDLSSLGWVDKLVFRYSCENVMAPAYFCIDNLVYVDSLTY